jgi:ATP-dependent RNA helicase DDX31/DBP7
VFDDAIFKLHGEMDHSTRKVMFSKFNESTCGLMLCTDVAARGLDFKSVKFVVHVDINREIKEYVNRIGRTARLNERGASIMFVMPSEVSYIDMLRQKEVALSEMKVGGVFTKYANNIFNDYKLKETAQGMLNRTKFMVKKYLEQYPSVQSLANKAYLSTTRALAGHYVKADYANYKKVNLTYLARGFGLYRNWTKTKTTRDNYDEKLMQQKKMRMDSAIGSEKKKIAMEFE